MSDEKISGFYGSLFEDLNAAQDRLVNAYNKQQTSPIKPPVQEPIVVKAIEPKIEENKIEIVKDDSIKTVKPITDQIVLQTTLTADCIGALLKILVNSNAGISISSVNSTTIEFSIAGETFELKKKV